MVECGMGEGREERKDAVFLYGAETDVVSQGTNFTSMDAMMKARAAIGPNSARVCRWS